MEDYVVNMNWIISGVLFWSTGFLLIRKLFPKRSYDFANRTISALHALVAIAFALMSVEDWHCPVCPLASRSSPNQMKALCVTFSYMVYDLVCCQFSKNVTVDTTIHHLVSIVGIAASLFYGKCGTEMVTAMFITELSSPFLHLREILKEFGIRDTDLNFAVDLLFAVTFSVARMVFGPYLTYVTLTADNPFIIKAMAVGLQLVSAYWFMRIVRMIKYKLLKRSAPAKLTSKTS